MSVGLILSWGSVKNPLQAHYNHCLWLQKILGISWLSASLFQGCHFLLPCMKMKSESEVAQSCRTPSDPMDCSPPGFSVHGIFQARVLQWGAVSFSNAEKWKVKVKSLSRVRLLATPWTAAHQAPPSMGLSRQEYWSGVPLPSPVLYPSQCQMSGFSTPQRC